MEKRICFKSKKIRKLFFKRILELNMLKTWNEFIQKFNIPRKTLDSYRSGKLTLPHKFYELVALNFNENLKFFFNNNIIFKDKNWGRIKGGLSTYSKHKNIFDEGRKKAIINRKNKIIKRKPLFDVQLPLNDSLSYFIGLFIGDGFTNKYGKYYLIQFTGNKISENYFYKKIISNISNKLFNLIPKIREEKYTNTIRVNYYSIDLFNLITKRFNIKAGRKSNEVLIPSEILCSNKEILLSCIAGIYDAEGSFYFDKRRNYKNPYPIICLHMNNCELIKQISRIFSEYKINHSYTSNYFSIYIYGKQSVNNFLSEIKLINPKYKEKIELLNSCLSLESKCI